jgi:RNA polymerase sigma factor (sigma-70 family)
MTLPPGPRIPDVPADELSAAARGDLDALDAVLRQIEPGVHALALRMLGDPDDAADATQDVLVRVATHLGGFAGRSRFSTWVFRIARNVVLTMRMRAASAPAVRLEDIAQRLGAGLAAGRLTPSLATDALSADDRAEAVVVARRCLQGMLLALPPDQRLVIVLDAVFGLDSPEAADVLEVTPAAYRQRLSRAKRRLREFLGAECGLEPPHAACRCDRQLPALRSARREAGVAPRPLPVLEVDATYDEMIGLFDALAVIRAQSRLAPDRSAPSRIREILRARGWMPA